MNMGRKAAKQFIFWLLLGLTAGIMLAAILSYHEYRTIAGLAGSVMRSDSLMQGLKENPVDVDVRRDGEMLLKTYGYRPMRNCGAYFPFTAGISILLFQLAGWMMFGVRYGESLRIRRRIRELTEYLRAVNSGGGAVLRRDEDIFSHLEDEMYKTVMELKSMKEAAMRSHEVLAERIADIAHQLKTPLTSMSLMTELLEEYQTGETREYYNRLSNQIERLKNLVTALLSLAKLDSHGIIFHEEKLEISELIEAAVEPLKDIVAEKQITLTVEKGICRNNTGEKEEQKEGCYIYADHQWTEEALLNIMKNCTEHTPEGGSIIINYSQNPIYTELRIEDSGHGFASEELPHIFERFYRGADAAKDNAGIGLALAKAVLEQQNGMISAQNTAKGHACFHIKWYGR